MNKDKVISLESLRNTDVIDFEVEEHGNSELVDCIVKLHEIAGTIERTMGVGALSERVRYSADILAQLMKKI